MPIIKVKQNGKVGHKWGKNGKVYFGKDSVKKATAQMKAAYANGYKGKK